MSRERPASVLVTAILCLVFGGIDTLCMACAGIGQIIQAQLQQGLAAATDPATFMQMEIQRQLPWHATAEIVVSVVLLVASIVLVVAGVGLLAMQNWARYLCIGYSLLVIAMHIPYAVMKIAVVYPLAEAAIRAAPRPGGIMPGEDMGFRFGFIAALVLQLVWFGGFALVLLILTTRASWVAAFSAEESPASIVPTT